MKRFKPGSLVIIKKANEKEISDFKTIRGILIRNKSAREPSEEHYFNVEEFYIIYLLNPKSNHPSIIASTNTLERIQNYFSSYYRPFGQYEPSIANNLIYLHMDLAEDIEFIAPPYDKELKNNDLVYEKRYNKIGRIIAPIETAVGLKYLMLNHNTTNQYYINDMVYLRRREDIVVLKPFTETTKKTVTKTTNLLKEVLKRK